MGTFILLVLSGLLVFVPIFYTCYKRKRSMAVYVVLFIVQLILWGMMIDDLFSSPNSDAMGNGMAKGYGLIFSIIYQVSIVLLTLIVLGVKSIIYSRKQQL